MKNTSVVIFPDTVPAPQVLTSLVPVFDQVVYCQPVENDDSGETLNPLCGAMTESLLCRLQYDLDRKRVEDDMQSIHQREQNLFSGLSSGRDNPFSMTGSLSSPVADGDRMQRLRLKAWSRLFAFGPNPVDEAGFFVATDPDAVDRIGEEFERSSGRAPDLFFTLPLPVRHPDPDRLLAQVKQFLEEESALVENLRDLLNNPAQSPELLQDWSAAMDRYFPRQEYGRCQLVLYYFPGVGLKQLFLDSFGHDEHELEGDIAGEPQRDIVVGLLTGQ
jgi:hypothetical protein